MDIVARTVKQACEGEYRWKFIAVNPNTFPQVVETVLQKNPCLYNVVRIVSVVWRFSGCQDRPYCVLVSIEARDGSWRDVVEVFV